VQPAVKQPSAARPPAEYPWIRKVGKVLLVLGVGLSVGLVALFAVSLPLRYMIPFLGVLIMPLMGILSLDFKYFFQTLLIASLCLPIRKALIALDPFMHSGGPFSIEIIFPDFVLFILYGIWLYEKGLLNRGPGFRVHPIGWAFLGYMVVVILSVWNAVSGTFLVFELVKLVKLFFLFVYVANNFRSVRLLRMTVVVICAFVCLHGLFSMMQFITNSTLYVPYLMPPPPPGLDELAKFYGFRRVGGIIQSANVSSTWLVMLIPLTFLPLFWVERRWFKALALISFALGLLGLMLTGTRAGWITIPFAVVTVLFLCFRKNLLSLRRHFLEFFAVALVCFLLFLPLAKGIISRLTVPIGESEYSRIHLIKLTLKMIAAHPIIGNGANNYNLTNIAFLREVHDPHKSLGKGIYHVVHNLWLLIAADTGLLGLFFFGLILYFYMKNCFAGLRSGNRHVVVLSIALIASLQNFFLTEMLDWSYAMFMQIYLTFWLFTALTVAMRHMDAPEDKTAEVSR